MFSNSMTLLNVYAGKRRLLMDMALRDFRMRYQGSLFGMVWAIVQPLAMMMILYFVFKHGLKAGGYKGTSFVSWFFSAVIAWNYFQDVIGINTNVYQEYAYLVKKVNFRLALLPMVKCLSALFLHLVFIAIVTGIIWVGDKPPSFHFFALLYYTSALVLFSLFVSWVCAILNVFYKDIAQVVQIIVQMGFWVTPIIWNLDAINPKYHTLMKLNPMYYLTEGYRNALVYHEGFPAADQWLHAYFWAVLLAVFWLAAFLFKKLKPHFSDVL